MNLPSALLKDSNQAGIGFLFVELDTALTFLGLAETTCSEQTALRHRNHARIAYESVLRYQGRVRFTIDEKAPFADKLAGVKRALIASGYRL